MAVRVRQVTRTTQPQEAVRLNQAHPLVPYLVYALIPVGDTFLDVVTGKSWTQTSTTSSANQGGSSVLSSGGGNSKVTAPDSINWGTGGRFGNNIFTVVHDIAHESLANWRSWWTFDGTDYGTSAFVQSNGGGNIEFILYGGTFTASSAIASGEYAHFAFVCRYTGGAEIWKNGAVIASTGNTIYPGNVSKSVQIFHADNLGSRSFGGSKSYWYAFDKDLTPAEITSLQANPWQLFEPEQIVVKTGAAASGTTLTPGNLALTLTGYAPTVTQTANVALTPGVVALILTGFAPTVTQTTGVTLTPGTAALTLTGYAPTVAQTANVSLTPDVLALTLTGYAPTVGQTTGLNLIPDTVALAVTGYTPTVAQTTNVFLTPSTLGLSLVGYAPTVTQTGVVVVTRGGKGQGSNLTLKQKKKLKAVVNQEWLKAEQTAKELLQDRLGNIEPAKVRVERLTTVQSLADVIAALQALSKETVTLPEQQAVIKSFEKSIDTKVVKTGERLVAVEDKVNETLGRIEKKIQNLEDLLIVVIDELL